MQFRSAEATWLERGTVFDCRECAPDQRAMRDAFGRFATGVTVITTVTAAGKAEGLTANSFSSLSLDPPLVLWSIRTNAPSQTSFAAAGHFAVNVLCAEQLEVSRHFSRPAHDKFDGMAVFDGIGGCPLLPGSLATFECARENVIAAGDHVIFIGRVLRVSCSDGQPLVFAGGRYAELASMRS